MLLMIHPRVIGCLRRNIWFLCGLLSGVDGGFDNNEAEYDETHNIVILPDYVTLPFPSVELPEKVIVVLLSYYFFL